ncbi:Spherulation-specific family 4, partial [Dactylonectria estremocensis]
PLFNAVKAHVYIPWLIVINPYNGPGESGLPGNNDPNVISGVSPLNENSNVNLIGYLPINYARASIDEVTANSTNWVSWSAYEDADISINGIFFDESYADADYMHTVVTLAREAFDHPITVVCNFGVMVSVEYYALCDIVLGFESCLNCSGVPKYKSRETIEANFPAGYESQGAVVVHSFTGVDYKGKTANVDLLTSYIKDIVDYGLGWFYFTSAGYEQLTSVPATVGQNADSLASAKIASLM